MNRIAPLSLLTICLFAGTALAAGPTAPSKPQPMTDHSQMQHHQMDHTAHHAGHGAQASSAEGFKALDANKDGSLSKGELAKHRLGPHFGMLDANRDGRLSPTEFVAGKGM